MLLRLQVNDDLALKTFEMSDAQDLFSMIERNRSYLREWLPWLDYTKAVKDSEGFIGFAIKEATDGTGKTFGVWKSNQLVGVCSYQKINRNTRAANIGYWISKDQSGQGIARTVTSKLIEFAFTELNLHRIEIRCASENIGSQKVAEKCGLMFEGTSRDCEWLYDHFVDHKVYSILSTDR